MTPALIATLFKGGGGAFMPGAARFDGTNDYMTRGAGLTGAVDSPVAIFSLWLKLRGGDAATQRVLLNLGSNVNIQRSAANKFLVNLAGAAGASYQFQSVGTYVAADIWLNILGSWNTNFAAGNKLSQLYINDVSDKTVVADASVAFDVDQTDTNWGIGARSSDGTGKLNGDMAEFYFAPGQFLDFSVVANRRKFISSAGLPVSLGADGSKPTGVAPLVYQSLRPGDAIAAFVANRGPGGGMTATGVLEAVAGPGSPFDFDVAVASATGNDSNDGTTTGRALQTLGAVPWANNLKVALI